MTGQEPFFPEALIRERVELILGKKEDVLLDELAQELSGEAQKDEFLILQTEFGEKSFRMKDIREAHLVDGYGETTDLLAVIRELLSKQKKGVRFAAFAIGAMAILHSKTSPNSARKEAFAKRKLWLYL